MPYLPRYLQTGLFLLLLLLPFSAIAKEVVLEEVTLEPEKSNRTILTVTGPNGETSYSHAQLEALGLKRVETSSFWPDDCRVFEGVLLSDLLAANNLSDSSAIILTARDAYTTEIPQKDWQQASVLIATRCNTAPLTIRSKGPTRIIYPIDQLDSQYANTEERVKWIWAIKSIANAGK